MLITESSRQLFLFKYILISHEKKTTLARSKVISLTKKLFEAIKQIIVTYTYICIYWNANHMREIKLEPKTRFNRLRDKLLLFITQL